MILNCDKNSHNKGGGIGCAYLLQSFFCSGNGSKIYIITNH